MLVQEVGITAVCNCLIGLDVDWLTFLLSSVVFLSINSIALFPSEYCFSLAIVISMYNY